MSCIGKQGDGMRCDTIENLNGHQPYIKGGRNREHRAEVFWGVNVFMTTMMVVVVHIAIVMFHCADIATRGGLHYHAKVGPKSPVWIIRDLAPRVTIGIMR
jgi:hypothetical protein